MKELACIKCHMLTNGKVCPNCHSTDLSPNWSGLVIVLDAEHSKIAKTLDITVPGRYELKVS
jgi:DNA-directed RNA polymerase subunit E"